MTEKLRKRASKFKCGPLSLLLKFLISVGFFYLIIPNISWEKIMITLPSLNLGLTALVFFLTLISIVISSIKLSVLVQNGTLRQYLRINFIGTFFNIFMPGLVGSDVFRIAYLKKDRQELSISQSTAIVFVDRATGLLALISLFFIGVITLTVNGRFPDIKPFFGKIQSEINVMIAVGILLFLAILLLVWSIRKTPLLHWLKVLYADISVIFSQPEIFLKSFALAMLFQLLSPVMFYLALLAIDPIIPIDFFYIMMVLPIISIIIMLPISIQGIGVREFLYLAFFPLVVPETLILVSIIVYFINLILGIIGFYFLLNSPQKS